MKSLHLNLAARPYSDNRIVYLLSSVLIGASIVLLLNNVQTAIRYFSSTEATRTEIAGIQKDTEAERANEKSVRDKIARVNLKTMNTQVKFINAQITERAFSWSALLDDLERLIPQDVRLQSLDPSISRDGDVVLNLLCVSKREDGLVRLLNALFSNPNFARPFPRQESMEGGQFRFTITVTYLPSGPTTTITGVKQVASR